MPELDIEIDGALRERALQAVEEFVRDHGTPVSRSQIAGLMQIAANEPALLARFAGKQKDRAQTRAAGLKEGERKAELGAEVTFWDLVRLLCEGKGPKVPWSLLKAREEDPAAPKLEKLPPGTALSKEDRERREDRRREVDEWGRRWDLGHYTGFFRHFCAHYLYRLPPEKR